MSDRLFKLDPWVLRQVGLPPEHLGALESLLTVSNGHLGIRGFLDEGDPGHARGTFLAGIHEEHPLSYPETGQAIMPVADGSLIRAIVDGSALRADDSCDDHVRELDLRAGTLTSGATWPTRSGTTVRVESTRLVALDRPGVAAVRYRLEAVDRPVRMVLRSELVANGTDSEIDNDDPRVADYLGEPFAPRISRRADCGGLLVHRTHHPGITVAASVHHEVAPDAATCEVECSTHLVAVDVVADQALRFNLFQIRQASATVAVASPDGKGREREVEHLFSVALLAS